VAAAAGDRCLACHPVVISTRPPERNPAATALLARIRAAPG